MAEAVVPLRRGPASLWPRCAQLIRPSSPGGDTAAQVGLCAGMAPTRSLWLRGHLTARTRFVDHEVLRAIGGGTSQIVILGAGYDDRSLRFRSPGVHYFELDHPATQSDKRRRLRRMGADLTHVTLEAADFRSDDVAAVLARGGHRADLPSLFICEGLLVYLDQATIRGLLAQLRSRAALGSSLAASLAVHPDGIDTEVGAGPGQHGPSRRIDRAVADHSARRQPPGPHRPVRLGAHLVSRRRHLRHRRPARPLPVPGRPARSRPSRVRTAGALTGPSLGSAAGVRATLVRNPLFATEE